MIDPATGNRAVEPRRRHPARPRHRPAKLLTSGGRAAHARPDRAGWSRGSSPGPTPGTVVLVGGGDPTLTALPAGQGGGLPGPGPARRRSRTPVRKATPGPCDAGARRHQPLPRPDAAPTAGTPADVAGRVRHPDRAADARRRPDRPHRSRTAPRVLDPALTAGRGARRAAGRRRRTRRRGHRRRRAPRCSARSPPPRSPTSSSTRCAASDNVLAEMLAREVAIARRRRAVVRRARPRRPCWTRSPRPGSTRPARELVDGSGLSTPDRVPAAAARRGAGRGGGRRAAAERATPSSCGRSSPGCRSPAATAPWSTGSRTGRRRPRAAASSGRKTGTLTGVSSLAGVVTDADGRLLVFALMSQRRAPGGSSARSWTRSPPQLRRCGCR